MNCAYASHNHFGRLCDERVYENDLAARLRAEGFREVFTQAPLTAAYDSFAKTYRLDLVVNQTVYELKVADAFTPEHETQVLNYAALLGLDRIKLLNFGAPSVQGKLIGCPFARADRHRLTVGREHWRAVTSNCEKLSAVAEGCLRDWGGFLEVSLYKDALMWLLGGSNRCERRLPVTRDGLLLGQQLIQTHAEACGFVVTALGENLTAHADQLRRLLNVLPLQAWQWINIFHQQMDLITILK